MGKPYDKEYHFAGHSGTTGTMICIACSQPIFNHAHDWMEQRRDKAGDWFFETMHRKCCADQSGWEAIEKEQKKAADKKAVAMDALRKTAAQIGVSDPYLFADLAAEALGEPDLDGHYFDRFGSG